MSCIFPKNDSIFVSLHLICHFASSQACQTRHVKLPIRTLCKPPWPEMFWTRGRTGDQSISCDYKSNTISSLTEDALPESGSRFRKEEDKRRKCVRCIWDCVTRAQSISPSSIQYQLFHSSLNQHDGTRDSCEWSDKILRETSLTFTLFWTRRLQEHRTPIIKRNPSNKRTHRTQKKRWSEYSGVHT